MQSETIEKAIKIASEKVGIDIEKLYESDDLLFACPSNPAGVPGIRPVVVNKKTFDARIFVPRKADIQAMGSSKLIWERK